LNFELLVALYHRRVGIAHHFGYPTIDFLHIQPQKLLLTTPNCCSGQLRNCHSLHSHLNLKRIRLQETSPELVLIPNPMKQS